MDIRSHVSVGVCVSADDGEWRTIRGKFLAINAASMSCACPRSPKGLSPAAHLADGTTDLILVRKCSRFNFLRHLLRHINKNDQVHVNNEYSIPPPPPHSFFLNYLHRAVRLLSSSFSSTWPLWRSTGWSVSASPRATARATQTWNWTCLRMARGRFSATFAETTRLVDAHALTAAGTATVRS